MIPNDSASVSQQRHQIQNQHQSQTHDQFPIASHINDTPGLLVLQDSEVFPNSSPILYDGSAQQTNMSTAGSQMMPNQPSGPFKATQPIPKKSAIIKTDRPRPHVCLTCTRAFARLEHLRRHERSHTNEKPFQCAACGRCFARRDLVLRHQQKLHANLSTTAQETSNDSQTSPGTIINKNVRTRGKNYNSNIIEHKNNTDKIKPLPGQDSIPPGKGKKPIAAKDKIHVRPKMENEELVNRVFPVMNEPSSNLNGSNIANFAPNQFFSPFARTLQQQHPHLQHQQVQLQQQQQHQQQHSSIQHPDQQQHRPPPNNQATLSYGQVGNVNPVAYAHQEQIPPSGQECSPHLSTSDSTSPNDSLYNSYAFSPSSTLNSMSRTATNDVPSASMTLTKSNLTKIDSNPLDRVNSASKKLGKFSTESHAEVGEADDILTSFQMFETPSNKSSNFMKDEADRHPHHRHNLFSATSVASYTLPKDAQNIHTHDIPEGPHQIGYSTPQLSATELASKAMFPNVDIDSFGIDWSMENFSLDAQNKDGEGDYFSSGGSGFKGSNGEGITPYLYSLQQMAKKEGGHDGFNVPVLQELLSIGGAGGGGGFDDYQSKSHDDKDDDGSAKNTLQDTWLEDFIKTPLGVDVDINRIGFADPKSEGKTVAGKFKAGKIAKFVKKNKSKIAQTDIASMFRSRQIDLFQKLSSNEINFDPSSVSAIESPSKGMNVNNSSSEGFHFDLFTNQIRSHILSSNNIKENQFPNIGELNSYIFLYHKEFDRYFPFVHLPSIESGLDNIPLLLAVAAIGALYSFHSSNSLLLFGVSKQYIYQYLEAHKSYNNDDVPLWLIQCLTLNMFLGVFNNDESLNKSISRQLNSLIYLLKRCSLHLPLEKFLCPNDVASNGNADSPVLKDEFDYFILAQSRIRTVHTILLISVLFDTLIGVPIILKSEEIECGSPCVNEELWKAPNHQKWFQLLIADHYVIDSKFSLIQISNGEPFVDLLAAIENNDYVCLTNKNLGLRTLLGLLMNLHQRIYERRIELNSNETNPSVKAMKWRMNDRPILESFIKFWELLFIRNGGILNPNSSNIKIINKSPILKLILPLLAFAKIRLRLSVTPILERVWVKDWDGMNVELVKLESDSEALRETAKYCLSIIELWIDLISVANDAQKTSKKTPIFFLTCTFTAILCLSEYLYAIELLTANDGWAPGSGKKAQNVVTAVDSAIFIKVSQVLKKVSVTLSSNNEAQMSLFAESLRTQFDGVLDFQNLDEEFNQIRGEDPESGLNHLCSLIKTSRLSCKCLYIGVRILADAPIWPAAMLFAEALKARSLVISKSNESTPNSCASL